MLQSPQTGDDDDIDIAMIVGPIVGVILLIVIIGKLHMGLLSVIWCWRSTTACVCVCVCVCKRRGECVYVCVCLSLYAVIESASCCLTPSQWVNEWEIKRRGCVCVCVKECLWIMCGHGCACFTWVCPISRVHPLPLQLVKDVFPEACWQLYWCKHGDGVFAGW